MQHFRDHSPTDAQEGVRREDSFQAFSTAASAATVTEREKSKKRQGIWSPVTGILQQIASVPVTSAAALELPGAGRTDRANPMDDPAVGRAGMGGRSHMDDVLSMSPHARTVLLGDRRCTASNRQGERCGRASALGQFVCNAHGAKSPLSMRAGRERLLALAEPALGVLYRATRNAPPCEHCGRSDADRDPVAVRAAGMILDRCGFGPSAEIAVTTSPTELTHETTAQVLARAEILVGALREQLADEAAQPLPATSDAGAVDGVVVSDLLGAACETPGQR
jgi:hypothetical protein